jgi:dimethylamine corrinoid protein
MKKEAVLKELRLAVYNRDENAVESAAKKVFAVGLDPIEAIEKGLAVGLREVGDKFDKFELFLSDMMLAANIMIKGVEILKSGTPEDKWKERKGVVVIGTVKGDIHDIGKNLVKLMLMVDGFDVHDLGIDVSPERFIEKAKEVNAKVICLSSLLSTTMGAQADFISLLKDLNLREEYKVIVGGAPVTEEWAKSIGADAYGKNSTDAVKKVNALLNCKKVEE